MAGWELIFTDHGWTWHEITTHPERFLGAPRRPSLRRFLDRLTQKGPHR
jgi:hypothetical protein